MEQVDFIQGNQPSNNPYANTYNPGWRNHSTSLGVVKDSQDHNNTQDFKTGVLLSITL